MFSCANCKKSVLFFAFILFCAASWSQIVTAAEFFKSVSEKYGSLRDFEATIDMNVAGKQMSARMSFKRPNLLRMDFSNPNSQTIVFDGELLTIYLPGQNVILNQTVSKESAATPTPQGLALMSRYYSIAYETGPEPVSVEGLNEQVVVLALSKRSRAENFRTMRLLISPDSKLIKKIEATANDGKLHTYSFSNYSLNAGIPEMRFVYDPPASASNYNNFLSKN